MLLIQCPSCKHDNTPGERFCAVCGVPLHLKPCPACGKVDHVSTKICSGCGAAFPPLAPTHYVTEDDPQAAADMAREDLGQPGGNAVAGAGTVPSAPKQVVASGAWPLIVVALAAGGIPLLWMNRANLPLPKAWQIQGPNATGSAITPATPPLLTPATATAPPAPPAKADPAPVVTEAPRSANDLPAPKPAAAPVARTRASHHVRIPPSRPIAKRRPGPVEPKAAARPCTTDALSALDLCDPKAGKQ